VAALRGHRKCLEVLIDNDLLAVNRSTVGAATTPLMFASSKAREDTVKLLLDSGADVTVVDNFGRTALIGLIPARLQRHTEDNDSEMFVSLFKHSNNLIYYIIRQDCNRFRVRYQ